MNFKVGQLVARTESSSVPSSFGEVGRIYEVLAVKPNGDIQVIFGKPYACRDAFKLATQQVTTNAPFKCAICAADYGTQMEASYCKELCEALAGTDLAAIKSFNSSVRQDASHVVQTKCECGSEACGSPLHSEYCPKFQRND